MMAKIHCQNENEIKLMDYIINVGILNCEQDYLKEMFNIDWDGKINVTYKIECETGVGNEIQRKEKQKNGY